MSSFELFKIFCHVLHTGYQGGVAHFRERLSLNCASTAPRRDRARRTKARSTAREVSARPSLALYGIPSEGTVTRSSGWGRDWGRFSGEIRNSTAELCACILRISGSFSKLAESCWSIFCLPSLRFGVELYVQYHSFESYVFEVNGCYSENRSEKCRSTPAAGGADMRAANHPGAGRLDSRPVYPYRRSP